MKFHIIGNKINYFVLRQNDKDAAANDCYPIIFRIKSKKKFI